MNIKVGDKVRIKTWDVLAEEGVVVDKRKIKMKDSDFMVYFDEMGSLQKVVEIDISHNTFYNGIYWKPMSAIAEVISQSLDEYICSLPLEERAGLFIIFVPYVRPFVIEGIFYSTITATQYDSYYEALQATIEALKQPKE